MSQKERLTDRVRQTWDIVYDRQWGKCWLCDQPMMQLAHIIPKSKVNLRKYGEYIIHHPANLLGACGLDHNKKAEISTKSQPIKAEQHAEAVKAIIRAEGGS